MISYTFTTCPQSNIVTFKDILPDSVSVSSSGRSLKVIGSHDMVLVVYEYTSPSWIRVSPVWQYSFYIELTLPSDKLVLGEYVGDPVEDIPNNCLCPIQTLMSIGCKCGGG